MTLVFAMSFAYLKGYFGITKSWMSGIHENHYHVNSVSLHVLYCYFIQYWFVAAQYVGFRNKHDSKVCLMPYRNDQTKQMLGRVLPQLPWRDISCVGCWAQSTVYIVYFVLYITKSQGQNTRNGGQFLTNTILIPLCIMHSLQNVEINKKEIISWTPFHQVSPCAVVVVVQIACGDCCSV